VRGVAAVVAVWAIGVAVAAAAVNTSSSGWAWDNPAPQGDTLRAIAFEGSLGYAVGDGGTALRTNDGGATWSGLATGTAAQLTRVQIVDAQTVVVGGGGGCVLRSSADGGQTFTRIFTVAEHGCSDPVSAFSFVTPQTGYLLLQSGSLLVTTDGGATFARRTGVPGTAASSGGGVAQGVDVHFSDAQNGIAFIAPPGGGGAAAYRTADGGVSWTPVTLPAGAVVTSVRFVDATHAYAIGPNTLLRSTDGGATWASEAIGAGNQLTSIDCSSATTCVLTVTAGDRLLRTTDGGATSSTTTPSSAPVYAAAFAAATRVVAVGAGGATVVSTDGGSTFSAASSDIGGQFSRLRAGPGTLVYAPGAGGVLAFSPDGGSTWSTLATQTSATLTDVAFATPQTGYALDAAGGLQQTTNGGASWRTLDPGTPQPASAVAALGSGTVLLFGPAGVYRSTAGGRFNPVAAPSHLADYDAVGGAVFAYGSAALTLSRNGGAGWTSIRLPLTDRHGRSPIRIRSVAFAGTSTGFLLDTGGRLWVTHSGGQSWNEVLSAGSDDGVSVVFSDAKDGFLTLRQFAAAPGDAYVLRTTDGGATWHPQLIAAGSLPPDGLVTAGPQDAFALIDGAGPVDRLLFSTTSGGDAGTTSALTLTTAHRQFTHRALRHAAGHVTVDGVLKGAVGGEQVVVSERSLAGGSWQHQVVTAGANGGSFTTNWSIGSSAVFVAQWAGDSGRAGDGSKTLTITVSH
jgi:photosystem II stability/assembly factor-like uncharacterized protein